MRNVFNTKTIVFLGLILKNNVVLQPNLHTYENR